MSDRGDPQCERLAARHRRVRRFYSALILFLLVTALLGGAFGWAATRHLDWLYGGLALAAILLVKLLWLHLIVFRPGEDHMETEQRLIRMDHRLARNARTTARWNGLLLILMSGFLLFLPCFPGEEPLRIWERVMVIGMEVGCGLAGIALMRWGWRKKPSDSSAGKPTDGPSL